MQHAAHVKDGNDLDYTEAVSTVVIFGIPVGRDGMVALLPGWGVLPQHGARGVSVFFRFSSWGGDSP